MKTTDNRIEKFKDIFYADNTFICGSSATILNEAASQLRNLNASGKRVLITDPYLFPTNPHSTYQSEIVTLLKGLGATQVIYCAKSKRNDAFFQQVSSILQADGITLDFSDKLDECHDRFWYCPETEKCVVFGTSLNGIGRKISRIDMLSNDEVSVLKSYFTNAGILTIGGHDES